MPKRRLLVAPYAMSCRCSTFRAVVFSITLSAFAFIDAAAPAAIFRGALSR